MLLFIRDVREAIVNAIKFQYISCYSLSLWEIRSQRVLRVSIHLMLLFIQKVAEGSGEKCKFQYISCYSLSGMQMQLSLVTRIVSIHLMLLFILTTEIAEMAIDLFQYISCYSLSLDDLVVWQPKNEFQYISCYSLSAISGNEIVTTPVSIHLMLLFIP